MKKCKVSFIELEWLSESEASEFETFEACHTYVLLDGEDSDSQRDFTHFDEFADYITQDDVYASFEPEGVHLLVDFGFIEIIGKGCTRAEARQSANAGKKLVRKYYNDFYKSLK
ncbi:MAG: hypothetical protein ACRCZZ_11010 [Phocaeicola sp.]